MNVKSHNYMKGAEFKTRQAWLNFTDAVGIVLEYVIGVKERLDKKAADSFKALVKSFRASCKVTLPEQQTFAFASSFSRHWKVYMPEINWSIALMHKALSIAEMPYLIQ